MISTDKIATILKAVRANDWWESKFSTQFSVIYATSILIDIQFNQLLGVILFLLTALIPGAVFVSIINDLTDIEVDKKVGKSNFFDTRSKNLGYIVIAICVIIGIFVSLFLSKLGFLLYLAAWIVFTCYSVSPIRLKNRGFSGVLADAFGAYVFPQLFTIVVIYHCFQRDLNTKWLIFIGGWSLCLGLRGILSHQLTDRINDEKSEVHTFVQRYQTSTIRNTVIWVVFPIELLTLGTVIFSTSNYVALILLAIYLGTMILESQVGKIQFDFVNSSKRTRLILIDFYSVFLPISFILLAMFPLSESWIIILVHLILFAKSIIKYGGELYRTFYGLYYLLREFLIGY